MIKGGLSRHEAERAFRDFGCSHFFMVREDPELYAAYKQLKISQEQETAWMKDAFREHVATLDEASTPGPDLWRIHGNATTLAESIGQIEVLRELYRVSRTILERVPGDECILCAENILGRKLVSLGHGVVFLAGALGDRLLAAQFLDLARAFATQYSGPDRQRLEQACERAETIQSMMAA